MYGHTVLKSGRNMMQRYAAAGCGAAASAAADDQSRLADPSDSRRVKS